MSAMFKMNPEDEVRFWEKVNIINGQTKPNMSTPCWEWTASVTGSKKNPSKDYGAFKLNGSRRKAHKVSYVNYCGNVPDGLCVCHKCDNTHCVRPDHLFLGTNADNMADKVRKGRQYSKLTQEQVLEIRKLYATGNYTQRQLADMFNVDQTLISQIVNRKIWKHI